LAYFAATSLDTDLRRSTERDLVREYVATLDTDITEATAWDQHRLLVVTGYVAAAVAVVFAERLHSDETTRPALNVRSQPYAITSPCRDSAVKSSEPQRKPGRTDERLAVRPRRIRRRRPAGMNVKVWDVGARARRARGRSAVAGRAARTQPMGLGPFLAASAAQMILNPDRADRTALDRGF
jgi:hypothetical protein